jgi:hypothetical protein
VFVAVVALGAGTGAATSVPLDGPSRFKKYTAPATTMIATAAMAVNKLRNNPLRIERRQTPKAMSRMWQDSGARAIPLPPLA